MVEETLKTARRIHYTILAVAAAFLLFAFAPRRAARYEAALEELTLLRSIRFDSMRVAMARRALAKGAERGIEDEPLADVLFSHVAGDRPFGIWVTAMGFGPTFTSQFELEPLPDLRIGTLAEYVRKNPHLVRVRPDPTPQDLAAIARDSATRWCAPERCDFGAGTLQLAGDHYVMTYQVLDREGGTPKEAEGGRRYTARFHVRRDTVPDVDVRGEIRRQAGASLFVDPAEGGTVTPEPRLPPTFLPRLRAVWTDVEDLTLEQADGHLREKIEAARRHVAFLGFSLDERIATVAGPAVLLLLGAYLSLYVRHLRRLVGSSQDRDAAAAFPWAPLFPGAAGTIVGGGTLVVLPGMVTALLVARSWGNTSALPISLTVVSGVMAMCVGAIVLSDLNALRPGANSPGAGAGAPGGPPASAEAPPVSHTP